MQNWENLSEETRIKHLEKSKEGMRYFWENLKGEKRQKFLTDRKEKRRLTMEKKSEGIRRYSDY